MKFPEKYIIRRERILHSGGKTNIFYDINALLTDREYSTYLLENIPRANHYIGIATGGEVIAFGLSRLLSVKCSFVKDNELKGEIPRLDYTLVDDVVTTGGSLEKAIKIIGKIPSMIVSAVDRRFENKNPEVYSIFQI